MSEKYKQPWYISFVTFDKNGQRSEFRYSIDANCTKEHYMHTNDLVWETMMNFLDKINAKN